MNTGWAPKPLRCFNFGMFPFEETPTVVKSLTPMQRQRELDGTPITVTPHTALRPPDPVLTLGGLAKGSLAEKMGEKHGEAKADPEDPLFVVKSYLEKCADTKPETIDKDTDIQKSLRTMDRLIQDLIDVVGLLDD